MVGWLSILIYGYLWDDGPVEDISIGAVFSQMIAKASRSDSLDNFRHPVLTSAEHTSGCHLGIDTWTDTMCSGKHAFVEEFVEGKSVTATGFTPSLGSLPSLPIANVLYAYDAADGTVLVLEANNSIYLGDKMNDSLMNPIQAEEVDVRVDVRPKQYYPDDPFAQTDRKSTV